MSQNSGALIIDDEPQVRTFVSSVLRDEGWEVSVAESAEQAFEMLHKRGWSIVFCDVVLGGADGFSVLRRFKEELPETKVVLMTGHGSGAGALDATAFGAYDYLLKPFSVEQLHSLSREMLEKLASSPTRRRVPKNVLTTLYASDIQLVGCSEAFVDVMKQLGRVAGTNLPVLLTGESGTGKEVVASALHLRSTRSEMPFIAFNCGAIPADLIESEFFGHVKGSFTGADRDRRGLWEEADGGAIFLDEITETAPSFQVKLLRVLQQGEIRRVGSNHTQKVDVRVIAASNRNVEEEVEAGRFRQDLFYRLNAVTIALPPLRERREDIVPLTKYFAEKVHFLNRKVAFAPEALALLERYPWPGNIRELENVVVRASAMCDGTVHPGDLPKRIRTYCAEELKNKHEQTTAVDADGPDDWPTLAQAEGRYVARVLQRTLGNKQAAARLLSVDRKTLDRMIKRHKIPLERLT